MIKFFSFPLLILVGSLTFANDNSKLPDVAPGECADELEFEESYDKSFDSELERAQFFHEDDEVFGSNPILSLFRGFCVLMILIFCLSRFSNWQSGRRE